VSDTLKQIESDYFNIRISVYDVIERAARIGREEGRINGLKRAAVICETHKVHCKFAAKRGDPYDGCAEAMADEILEEAK